MTKQLPYKANALGLVKASLVFKLHEKWAWNGVAVAVIFWFVVDTTCSLYYDVAINTVFNLFTFLLFAVPLFITRKYFYRVEKT